MVKVFSAPLGIVRESGGKVKDSVGSCFDSHLNHKEIPGSDHSFIYVSLGLLSRKGVKRLR
jgi:hypothetical protein